MAEAIIGRGVNITFLGHSAFKLTGAGVSVLIDPWLSNPLHQHPGGPSGPGGPHPGDPRPWRPRGRNRAVAQKTGAPVVAIHELSLILADQGSPR